MAARLRLAVDINQWSPAPPELALLLSLLPENERKESTKFMFIADQKRHLVSRLLARAAAHAALGLPHAEVLVQRTRGGKPYIANELPKPEAPNYNYSVSHEVRTLEPWTPQRRRPPWRTTWPPRPDPSGWFPQGHATAPTCLRPPCRATT